ncbi:MAG: DUF1778 domain-containing protein [Nitrososphaerota archaeon]|nr:DUF1778 domain-containing protein [Candidatus Calditenuaceae archaeon]MDW8074003.1 DUF1778 domain-containing protein [Nitrososphaerota archaeon]
MEKLVIEIKDEDVLSLLMAAAALERITLKEFILNSAVTMSKLVLNDALMRESHQERLRK